MECLRLVKYIRIEIPLFLTFFAFMLSDSVKTNLVIFRTCYVTLGYNKSECALLGTKTTDNQTAYLEKMVEPHAAVVNMATSMIDSFFSVFICLFVGPWSDRFGRKPILVIPVIGFATSYVVLSTFSLMENLSPWYILFCSIPLVLTGGAPTYLTALLCYITDVTSDVNRGVRMGLFEGFISLGILVGNIVSSYIFYSTSYPVVFMISCSFCVVAIVFTVFCIPESLTNRQSEGRWKGVFQLSNITEMLKVSFKKRRDYERCTVLCCIVSLTIFIVMINGDGAVIFLYLREKFHWSLEKYTLYSAYHSVTWILGTILGVYVLHKLLKIPETILILIGYMSLLNGTLMQGLARTDLAIYLGAFARCLGGVLSPMVRSLVSKVVPTDEAGKIFSLIVTSESLFGMAGSPIYTAIYNGTIKTDPSVFNFVTAGFYLVEIGIAIGLIAMRSLRAEGEERAYNELVNEEASDRIVDNSDADNLT